VTHNEKIVARKLRNEPANASLIADKIAVRDYVAGIVGPEYLKELLVVADSVEDVDFDALPRAFAAKASHGSGFNVIVQDRSVTDMNLVRKKLRHYLRTSFGRYTNERWYAPIPHRLLVEPFLSDRTYGLAVDFNFFAFGGRTHYIRVVDKVGSLVRDFYDRDWNLADFVYADIPRGKHMPRPARLDEMLEVADALATGLDFVRVDLFSPDDGPVLFGELTLAPGAGWNKIRPIIWDERLGSLWGSA
jgi:hypothetical protein